CVGGQERRDLAGIAERAVLLEPLEGNLVNLLHRTRKPRASAGAIGAKPGPDLEPVAPRDAALRARLLDLGARGREARGRPPAAEPAVPEPARASERGIRAAADHDRYRRVGRRADPGALEREEFAGVARGLAAQECAQCGERLVGAATARARIDAADLD